MIGQLYASLIDADARPFFVRGMCSAFSAHLISIQSDSAKDGHIPIAHFDDTGAPVSGVIEALVGSGLGNPLMEDGKADNLARLGTAHDEGLFPEGWLEQTDFYRAVLEPFEIRHSLGFCLRAGHGEGVIAMNINRSPKRGYFGKEDMVLARRMLPHLRNAHALQQNLRELKMPALSLDAIGMPAWLLDANGCVTASNALADHLCRTRDCLLVRRNRQLQAACKADDAMLRLAIAAATSKQVKRRHASVALHGRGGRPRAVADIHPLHPAALHPWMLARPAAAILILRMLERRLSIVPETLRHAFDLTPAETQLAVALLEHGALADCAAVLGKSRETLRTQLKSLLAKTGSRGQSELILRLRIPLAD